MFRDFIHFLQALWEQWKVLLTGSGLIVLGALWTMATGNGIPQSLNWLILGCTLIIAGFLSWRKVWIQSGRGFISHTPQQLTALCVDKHTTVQVEAILKPYHQKWMKISGMLEDVSPGDWFPPFPSTVSLRSDDRVRVFLSISRWGVQPFLFLPYGTRITVAGRVKGLSNMHITLTDCELIDAIPAQSASQPTPAH